MFGWSGRIVEDSSVVIAIFVEVQVLFTTHQAASVTNNTPVA